MADSDSILTSTKKALGLPKEVIDFDDTIVMHINSALATLLQICGDLPPDFSISDSTAVWGDLIGDRKDLNGVKTYVYLKTRIIFDPPQTGYLLDAMKQSITEAEWRLETIGNKGVTEVVSG